MNEREMEVLERYPFQAERISRVRGAFLCETKEGLRLLQETGSTEKRLQWENQILRKFPEVGRLKVDSYVENSDGDLITESSDHRRYCVKRWPGGRECDVEEEGELLRGVEVLGELHLWLRRIGSSLEPIPPAAGWQSELARHNRELVRTRNFVRKKHHKSELELQILADFPYYYGQAERALTFASGVEPPIFLCHGEFSHHHLLFSGRTAAVTEFSRLHWGVPREDLYLFLRKGMEKHDWSFPLGREMLARYERRCSQGEAERRYLFARLVYPEKFWKQVNSYYNRKKSWIPLRNLEKLKVLEEQREQKEEFLARLGEHWGIG